MSVQVYVNLHLFSNATKKQNSENKLPESHSQSLPAPMFVMWNETGKTMYTLKKEFLIGQYIKLYYATYLINSSRVWLL